jgi:hypothetical protein
MRLYVPTMDATLVGCERDGRVHFEGEEWREPSLQERRAILHAAERELEELTELVDILSAR